MPRAILVLLAGYVLLAVANKVGEVAGAMACDCADECWCRRAGLSLFRWVFPWRHRAAHTAEDKAHLAGAR